MKKGVVISILCIILLLNTTIIENISYSEENKFPIKIDNGKNPSLIKTEDCYMVAYDSNASGNEDIWISISKDGINWNKPIQITNNSLDEYYPSLIKSKDGYMIAYMRGFLYNSSICVMKSENGINWIYLGIVVSSHESPMPIEWFGFLVNSPSLIYGNKSYIITYIINLYDGGIGGGSFILIENSSNGINWKSTHYIFDYYSSYYSSEIENLNYHPSLIQTKNNSFMIAFSQNVNQNFVGYIITSQNLTNWSEPIIYSNNSFNPSLIQLQNNSFMIADNNGIFFSKDGTNWTKILNKNYTNPSLIQIEENKFMVAYENNNSIWIDTFEIGKKENRQENQNNFMNLYLIFLIIILAIVFITYIYHNKWRTKP